MTLLHTDSKPRVLKVDASTGEHETFFDLLEEHWLNPCRMGTYSEDLGRTLRVYHTEER